MEVGIKRRYFHGDQHEIYSNRFDEIQILTVEDLLDGKSINLPMEAFKKSVFKAATKKLSKDDKQESLF